jgi:hypothetical protein
MKVAFSFLIRYHFRATRCYIDKALWCYDCLKAAERWEFMEVQIIETKLSGSDSSTGNKCDKCLTHDQKITQTYSEVTI